MLQTEISKNDHLILIVDDLPKNLQVLGNILSNAGYRIAVATNGEQALRILDKKMPDLILLDVMMPGMDGFEVCRKIRSDKRFDNLPVLFVSAKSDTESKVQGFEIGAADYITKPFQAAEVLARVKTHLKLKKAVQTITEYNLQLESMLEERTRELIKSERLAAFSLFSQGIVHNLKNPLTSISGGAQIILLGKEQFEESLPSPKDAATQKYLDTVTRHSELIRRAVDKMLTMINSLMAKSQSDKNNNIMCVDINESLRLEISFLNADLRFKNQTQKTINLSDTALWAEVVPSELSQIFQNLIQNALDAMHGQEDATIEICSGENENEVWFAIKDNGPGIPEDIKARIYDPFFTTKGKVSLNGENGANNGKPTGTGLGLHICSQMVNSYKGRIQLQSQAGKGTSFTVSFPKALKTVAALTE